MATTAPLSHNLVLDAENPTELVSVSTKGATTQNGLPFWNSPDDWQVIRIKHWSECFGGGRVTGAFRRLKQISEPGYFRFHIHTAQKPVPFFPQSISVVRQKLERSTRNGQRFGSRYNNFALSSLFEEHERRHISVNRAVKRLGLTQSEFQASAKRFMEHFDIQGDPNNLSTWSNWDGEKFDARFKSYKGNIRLTGILKTAAMGMPMVIVRNVGIVSFDECPVASLKEIEESLDKIFVAMNVATYCDQGVVVPSLFRAFLMWGWLILSTFVVVYTSARRIADFQLWSKDFFEALVFIAVSVPALVEYISLEPSVIRNALRANRVLRKNSQIKKYFRLNKFDYAVMALISRPMWLVSDHTGSFLQEGGHAQLEGDIKVTDTASLQRVGVYVGFSMARREWENTNFKVASNADGSVSILQQESTSPFLSGYSTVNRPVS